MPVSSRHRPAAATILGGHVYEPNTIEFIKSHCHEGDIIHAGTYFGDFLPGLAASCKGKIWAFEPNLENHRCAQVTLLLNDISNVVLVRGALGANADCLPLRTAGADGLAFGGASAIVAPDSASAGRIEMVPVLAIDDAVPADRLVSVLQLDVEGHEQQALTGALKTIARCRPVIIVEILEASPLRSTDWLSRNVLSLGYRMTGTIHGNAIFLPD